MYVCSSINIQTAHTIFSYCLLCLGSLKGQKFPPYVYILGRNVTFHHKYQEIYYITLVLKCFALCHMLSDTDNAVNEI